MSWGANGGHEGLQSVTRVHGGHALQHVHRKLWSVVLPRLDIGLSRRGGLQPKQSEGQGVHGTVPGCVQQEGPPGALPSHCHGSTAALNGATAPVQLPFL